MTDFIIVPIPPILTLFKLSVNEAVMTFVSRETDKTN